MNDHPLWAKLKTGLCLFASAMGFWAGSARAEAVPEAEPVRDGRSASVLASEVQREGKSHPNQSAIHPLPDSRQSLAARIALIRAADRSVDVQYYIWKNDASGLLLLHELSRAADRGVQVRLLVDDFPNSGMDALLSAMDAHPGAAVRLFNPFRHRNARFLDFLTSFSRVNRRMHNKSMTADRALTIVGGRNVGDNYFGGEAKQPVADLDVLAAGPAAEEVADAFEVYWTCPFSRPVREVVSSSVKTNHLASAGQDILRASGTAQARAYLASVRRFHNLRSPFEGGLRWEWCRVQVLVDDPAKAHVSGRNKEFFLAPRLDAAIDAPRERVDLVSPYFVPGKSGTEKLAALEKRGVQVRVLTNSMASNNVLAVHAGYAPSRKPLLRAGVSLYEVRPDAGAPSALISLHAKTFSVDGTRLFVGSFNMDPRSYHTNTEMGLLIDSPSLASATSSAFTREIPRLAYEVRLNARGHLEWVEQNAGGPIIHRHEPSTTAGRRFLSRVISFLPIKRLL